MDVVGRTRTSKKANKENAQPAHGSKSFIKRDVAKTTPSVAPFHLKSNDKETVEKDGSQKGKAQQATPGAALKNVKTVQKEGGATGAKKQTHSQVFLTEQAVRHRKVVAEAPKTPAAFPPSKSAPGMYKGKVVQSKIGSIWKSSGAVGGADPKPTPKPPAPKVSQKAGHLTKSRSKSVADLPGRGMPKPKPTKSNSMSEGFPPVSKRNVGCQSALRTARTIPATRAGPISGTKTIPATRPGTASSTRTMPATRPGTACSTRTMPATRPGTVSTARTIPATRAGPVSRNTTSVPPKGKGTQSSKPKMPVVTDKKVNRPPVSSSLSQYRATMETAEERKAKLAEWLALKGKSLKRPAMATASKTKVAAKAEVPPQSQAESHVEAPPAVQSEAEPSLDAPQPLSAAAAAAEEETQKTEETAQCPSTPMIMNTTLDLLDNSDMDLPVDPDNKINDIVLNLCDVLEAMAPPSTCEDDECNDAEMEHSTPKEGELEEVSDELEEVGDELEDVEVKNEAEEDDQKVNVGVDDVESDEEEDDVIETTPKMEEASVVKYSVTTTPYLQSVKKTIEGEASASGRKSSIKDLKFLTPVRRSSRIHRQSSRLPLMLGDHDPCVSSLAELVQQDDANAYIYRRNPAILHDLPDQPSDL